MQNQQTIKQDTYKLNIISAKYEYDIDIDSDSLIYDIDSDSVIHQIFRYSDIDRLQI